MWVQFLSWNVLTSWQSFDVDLDGIIDALHASLNSLDWAKMFKLQKIGLS